MQVRAGRPSALTECTDDLAGADDLAIRDANCRQVAVEQAHMCVHELPDVVSAAACTATPLGAARSIPVCTCRPGQNGSYGSSSKLVHPKGRVTTAPVTMPASGNRTWLGICEAVTTHTTPPPATIATMRRNPVTP